MRALASAAITVVSSGHGPVRHQPVVPLAVIAAVAVCSASLTMSGPAMAGTHAAGRARAAVSSGTWGTAQQVPGLAALNKGGDDDIISVSCASPGNCSAAGYYGPDGGSFAFVVDETNGIWQKAEKVAGFSRFTTSSLASVSCGAPGNCGAVGSAGISGINQGFVVTEANGAWGRAQLIPGLATLDQGGGDSADSVSCSSAGNCSAGGGYSDSSLHVQAFVAGETNGTWGTAQEVPGTAALDQGADALIQSVSCASPGNCSAGGWYDVPSGIRQAFVADETNGVWGAAQEVPGIAALNKGDLAMILSVSCTSPGNCTAGGRYHSRPHSRSTRYNQAFVVTETDGTWGTAQEVPGTAALNKGNFGSVSSVSCASPGNCTVGGSYTDGSGHGQAFVADEAGGAWGTARKVPGTKALNKGGSAGISSVSCGSPGNCGAGGWYVDGTQHTQVFVADEAGGAWGAAQQVPGTKALNKGGEAYVESVSCAAAGSCSAGGVYTNRSGHFEAFVVGES